MSPIETYLVGSLCVCSMMLWWFTTNLPIHVVQIIKLLGYRKDDKSFWESDTPIELWTQMDLQDWKIRNLPSWLDELSSCPGCLSMHLSLWTSVLFNLVNVYNCRSFSFFLLAWLGWPYISNLALYTLKKLQKN